MSQGLRSLSLHPFSWPCSWVMNGGPPRVRRNLLAAGRGRIRCSEAPTGMFSPLEFTWTLGGDTPEHSVSRVCMKRAESSKLGPATHWIPL